MGRPKITAVVGLAFLLGLSGCNQVVSIDPWFTAADAKDVPQLREGLWLTVFDAECEVDVLKPAERWPDCATALFVRGDERLTMAFDDHDHDSDGPRRRSFVGWRADPS